MNEFCIIKTTYEKKKDANKVATLLIAKRLAACVQVSKITSFYNYKKKTNKTTEYILSIKTK